MAITGPTDETNIHESQVKKFQRFISVDEDALVQLDLVDTGKVTSDGLKIFAMGTIPAIPGSSSKISPGEGTAVVALAGTGETIAQFPITSATILTSTFTIARDWARFYKAGDTLTVSGCTMPGGNDGVYTVVSAVYATGTTSIVVAEAISSAVVEGTIVPTEMLVQSLVIQAKSTNTGDVIPGDVDAAAGLGFTLAAKDRCSFDGNGYPMDLAEFYIDVTVNGDGVTWYILG